MTNFGPTTPFGAIEDLSICSTSLHALDMLNSALREAISTEADLEAFSNGKSSNLAALDGLITLAECKWQTVDAVLLTLPATDPRHPEDPAILRVASLVNTLRCFEGDPEGAQIFVASLKNRGWLHLHSAHSTLSTAVNTKCKTTLDLFEDMSMLSMYGGDGLPVTPEPGSFAMAMAA